MPPTMCSLKRTIEFYNTYSLHLQILLIGKMGFTNDSMLLYVICLFSPMLFNSELLNGVTAILL